MQKGKSIQKMELISKQTSLSPKLMSEFTAGGLLDVSVNDRFFFYKNVHETLQ